MSTYIKDSEISRLNHYQESDWFPVSEELLFVIKYSHKISQWSDGAFDITVGPLVNLWGFGPEDRTVLIPEGKDIEERKKFVGFQNLTFRESPPAIKKSIKEVYCDLAAIAKGYGVDQLAEFLNDQGIENYMVDIGGEIRTRGKNAGDVFWKIGVATPDEEFGVQKVIPLENQAVATSGDYRNYFESEGQRFSHTIDPRTGKPVTHQLASVTVIHDTCMVADGIATAISVMGPERGLNFANERELPVFLIVRGDNGFIEKMTPQFEKILELNKIGE